MKSGIRSPRPGNARASAMDERLAWEMMGIIFLIVAVVCLLQISWRKWPDPLIDFGRELYLPWRLSEGAVLYRDLDANYGPLSHYFNALIFRITGVGYIHLVWVNFAIYLAILALIYAGLRIGWGRLAAFVGSLVFVTVFSFNQLQGVANYNYLSPYSHETTHGFLLVLILIHLWASWLRHPRPWKVASAGLCCGLCVLLKVEIIFAAGIVTIGALARALITTKGLRSFKVWIPIGTPFVVAGLLPSLSATLLLWLAGGFGLITAFSWANIAWTGLFVYKNIASDPIQMQFLGLTDIPGNLATIVIYGGLSVAGMIAFAAICGRIHLRKTTGARVLLPLLGAFSLLAGAGLASYWLPWLEWGVTFPVGLCLALFIAFRGPVSVEPTPQAEAANTAGIRWLFLLAAGAFLARMCLFPRVYHYGYYQAALAGIVIVSTAFRSLPDLFSLRKSHRSLYLASLGIFLSLGLWKLAERSYQILGLRTEPMGEGADLIYGFSAQADATTALLEAARSTLSARPDCHSLLVLPEGVMLNYLLRKPVPISAYNFNPYWLNWRDQILEGLQKSPPDYVAFISRDMREYGMNYFGDSPEHGQKILAWINSNYGKLWQAGGNPLDINQRGVVILQKMRRVNAPLITIPVPPQ
jgi:hypothetical protein